jgi:phage-related protein
VVRGEADRVIGPYDSGTYRVIYMARMADAVYVLHAFQKKTRTTAKRDVELAKKRFTELTKGVP